MISHLSKSCQKFRRISTSTLVIVFKQYLLSNIFSLFYYFRGYLQHTVVLISRYPDLSRLYSLKFSILENRNIRDFMILMKSYNLDLAAQTEADIGVRFPTWFLVDSVWNYNFRSIYRALRLLKSSSFRPKIQSYIRLWGLFF